MPRTVSVRLAADVANYEAGMKGAEQATDDLKDKIEETGVAGAAAAAATDALGHEFRDTAGDARKLKNEIQEAENSLRALALEYAAASSVIDRNKIADKMSKQVRELRELKDIEKLLPKPAQVEAAGNKIGKSLGSSIGEALSNAPVWAPFAAAAAPLLGATISAAVIGGAGVGGVIGGVLLASRDPRVAAAGTALGQSLLGQLEKDAQPFVEPVLQGINKIEIAFHSMNGEIKSIFSGSAGFLAPLEDGAIEAVHGILSGINSLVANGKPVIDQLGKSFGQIGNATGYALKTISGDSEDAAKALKDLTDVISLAIRGTGWLVRGLTELYGPVTSLPRAWVDMQKAIIGWDDSGKASIATASVLATVQKTAAGMILSAGEAAGKAGLQMQTYGDKMDEASAKGRGLYDSQTNVAQAVADAEKAIKENGKTLDINSQKGRDNRKALSGVAEKLVATYDAYVKVNGEGAAAGKVAERNRDQFVKLAEKFGKSATEANHLADSMGLIKPKSVDVHVNTHDAIGRANAARDALNAIHGKNVSVNVSVTGLERLDAAGHRIGGFRADGGPVKKNKAYVVGERHAEVFVPDRDGTIIPSIDQYSTFGGSGGTPNWQAASSSTVINAPTTVNLAVTVGAGSNPAEAGRQIAHALEAHLSRGGEIRVNGRVLVGNS
jgi:hypothetical protein